MRAWRCYALSSLSADRRHYVSGSTYCTRDVQLRRLYEHCAGSSRTISVDAAGTSQQLPPQNPPFLPHSKHERQSLQQTPEQQQNVNQKLRRQKEPEAIWGPRRMPGNGLIKSPPPTYVHDERLMKLPTKLDVPRIEECGPGFADQAEFWAVSLYSASYAEKAKRLVTSCELFGICCKPAFMPNGVFDDFVEGSHPWR